MAVPEPRGGREVVEGVGAHVGVSKESEVEGIVVTLQRAEESCHRPGS